MKFQIKPIESDQNLAGLITARNNTRIKTVLKDSSLLSEEQYVAVTQGTRLPVLAYDNEVVSSHQLFTFKAVIGEGGAARTNWYLYTPHWELDEVIHEIPTEAMEAPEESPRARGEGIRIPVYGLVGLNDLIPGTKNFTWNEALHGGTRIPTKGNCYGNLTPEDVIQNIVRVAAEMQKIRDSYFGGSITINSWYRDPATNRRVNGASRSRHLFGDSCDFTVAGVHCQQVYKTLNSEWQGGLAATVSNAFVHIDCRHMGPNPQPKARWKYPF